MKYNEKRIDKYDAEIKKYVHELCPDLLIIPGVDCTTAGLIAGEIGDAERFHSAESLIGFSGIDPVVYELGEYKAKHMIPSKNGSKYLRYELFQVARIIWQCDPTYRAYYDKKQDEGKHYYVILGHIQKKVIRLIHSLLKSGNNYEVRSV